MRPSNPCMRALLLGCAVTACAAKPSADQAIIDVRVVLDAHLDATCVTLEMHDSSGAVLDHAQFERTAGKDAYSVAVLRTDGVPAQVGFIARASKGDACNEPLTPVAASDEQSATFAFGQVKHVEVA